MGGLVAQVLSFVRVFRFGNISDTKVDTGAGANITCEHFADAGDDSHPMPDDYVALVRLSRTGNAMAVGYVDTKNASTAALGEKRIYSRDENGVEIARVHLKNTGEVEVVNANGSITLKADGQIDLVNSVATFKIYPTGQITGANPLGSFGLTAAGEVGASNANGYMKLLPNGNVDLNGVIITPAGATTIASGQSINSGSVVVDGKELKDHVHSGVDVGPSNTGPNQ